MKQECEKYKNFIFLGNPIICNSSGLIQSYCWIQGMWTIKEKDNLYNHGTGVQAHPGVGVFNPDRHEKVFHRFYQWVPFVLLISAFVFYLPRYLWTIADDGRMAHICKDMQDQVCYIWVNLNLAWLGHFSIVLHDL